MGEKRGRAKCTNVDESNTGKCAFVESTEGDVEVYSLDELELDRFHFLKVDVEGAELDVLKGAKNSIGKFKPLIFCEAQTQNEFQELKDYLRQFSYQPRRRFCVTPTYLFEIVR